MGWLIVGFGCDLAGDDGFGIAVANFVAEHVRINKYSHIDVLSRRILTPELVTSIINAEGVIFIDASATLSPGAFRCTDLRKRLLSLQQYNCSGAAGVLASHSCDPLTLLQLAHVLYNSDPPAWLYAAGAANFYLSENLSSTMAALVPMVAQKILGKIKS